eukprot:CAMPEP_0119096552 /NCGR_PEP_ID=MMETSP1178-20130426/173227_1 /TAXON_ID=33656 /ORGANISM="unid sp, Strain CCMP2000" /LENGTH=53 /DNA_ID=CAMNT_0007080439 /DNA_START=112 /DNA_END=269 /DNA_ORIENTATION=-
MSQARPKAARRRASGLYAFLKFAPLRASPLRWHTLVRMQGRCRATAVAQQQAS